GGDRAVLLAVCLQALEDLLAVVQRGGRRIEFDRTIWAQLRVMPAVAGGVLDRDHMVGEVAAEAGITVKDRGALGVGERLAGRLELDGGRHRWSSSSGGRCGRC